MGVGFDEFFKRMTSKLTPNDTVDDIMQIFELFDNDTTGTITYDNLLNVGRIIGAKETQQQIMEIISTLDSDGDSELCPVDFYTCLVNGMRLRMFAEENAAKAQADAMARNLQQQSQDLSNSSNQLQRRPSNR